MRKLKLDTDTLRVESFTPEAHLAGTGTVQAHATPPTFCGATCAPTCNTNCDCTLAPSCLISRCTIVGWP